MIPYLSKHSKVRIEQRTALTQAQICDLLHKGHGVVLGQIPGLNRNFVLFWSVPDQGYFVAVQDYFHQTIITVLPLSYHEKINFKVNQKFLDEAREKPYEIPLVKGLGTNEIFYLRVAYSSRRHNTSPTYFLAAEVPAANYGDDIMKFAGEKDLIMKHIDAVIAKQNLKIERVFGFTIEFRNNTKLFAFESVYKVKDT